MDKLPAEIDRNHPLITQQYCVYTPPIGAMATKIGDWIEARRPGGYIYGSSRLGKTRGVLWHLNDILAERFQMCVPMVIWIRPKDFLPSMRGFWHQLLLASNWQFVNPLSAPRKDSGAHLVEQRFISIANNSGSNYVVLVIDEAQAMLLKEWHWMATLQNSLDAKGYILSVFSVGTHQLGYQHDLMSVSGDAHIVARFFVGHAPFHGIKSLAELEFVLQGYDEDSEWPPGSKFSFTRYFANNDFAAGYRLQQTAELQFKSLNELTPDDVKKKMNVRGNGCMLEFPMQHIARSNEAALKLLAQGIAWEQVFDYKNILQRLHTEDFSDYMRIISSGL